MNFDEENELAAALEREFVGAARIEAKERAIVDPNVSLEAFTRGCLAPEPEERAP